MDGETPAKLADAIIDGLRKREHGGFIKLPPPPSRIPKIGQSVRILTGSFTGHIGVYEGQSAHERICVLLDLLGRAVPTELAKGDQIAPLS